MNPCIVEGCARPRLARYLCSKHYQEAKVHGRLPPKGRTGRTVVPVTHPLYVVWGSMKTRCDNPNSKSYERYGAKGIKYCEEWADFNNSYTDMQEGYGTGLWLDRIDGSKGYYKDNCRWVTPLESNRNRSSVKLSEEKVIEIKKMYATGVTQEIVAAHFGIDQTTVSDVIRRKSWSEV